MGSSISEKLHEIRRVISRKRKLQFVLTLLFILTNAFFEIVSLAAVVPFLSVLSSPQTFMESSTARKFAPVLGIKDAPQAVATICIAFALITVVSAVVRTITTLVNSKFTLALGADLSKIVFERTLHQPYETHSKQNSAAAITNVIQNVHAFVNGILTPSVQFLTSSLTVFGIIVTLFVVNWWVALASSVIFGGSYFVIVLINKPSYSRNSELVVKLHVTIIKALQEGLGAIRDVIIDGNHNFYVQAYSIADKSSRVAQNDNYIRSVIPKYVLESVGMLLICTFSYVLSRTESNLLGAVPVLGALAMGAQRLLPAMQSVFGCYSTIVTNIYGFDQLIDVLRSDQILKAPSDMVSCGVEGSVAFINVEYRYSLESSPVLRKVSFEIQQGERIGVIGATGSGKSTTMDLLLGLLQPTSGHILIDGEPLVGDKVFAWQKSLSHVPQVIYLADASIAENIAFGLPKDKIDMNQVRKAASLAQIAEHIESLELGYDTFVGERGIRLSGGQRQRIGIARALYKNATVLVFDEATSALDDETEAELMKAIDGLSKDLTVIMIAHRLSTVRRCDKILKLHKGKVVAFDTPDIVLGPAHSA
jgi:ABC-type multidrug transport system fused ATPase/permease subunit